MEAVLTHLVAERSGRVVGFLRALSDGEVTTYICELAVEESLRRQGIGRALLDFCHELCPHTRLDLLCSDESSAAFYEKAGFHRFLGYRRSRV